MRFLEQTLSSVLDHLANKVGMSFLPTYILYAILAAQHLAKAGIKDAIDPICDRLRNSKSEEIDLITGLLDALSELNQELPQDLWERFTDKNIAWQIKTIVQEKFLYKIIKGEKHSRKHQQIRAETLTNS